MGLLRDLEQRHLVAQCTNREELEPLLARGAMTLYVGIDPTAPSLHVGHLAPVLLAMRLAHYGNSVIIIVGDGTAKVGDPSGKSETRQLMSNERINANSERITEQLKRIFMRHNVPATFVRNGAWLNDLNYMEFLRDIGSQFSVNHMLSFEAYRRRLNEQHGLSFIEFNYMLLQAYDFYILHRDHQCALQIGGDDQWGNIVAGIDLIRRLRRSDAYGLTAPLLITADGAKMGKTARGAVFLDQSMTSLFDFYQYWRNIADTDVRTALLRLTECDIEDIERYTANEEACNSGKEQLAYAITSMVHGQAAADEAQASARALFGARTAGAPHSESVELPGSEIAENLLANGIRAIDLFAMTPLCASNSEAKRLIEQGGAQINGIKIGAGDTRIDSAWVDNRQLILRAGKKRVWQLTVR